MKNSILFFLFPFCFITSAFACFWDYDTIEMERQKFPSVIELISGKFLRHSSEFHLWRIKDREAKLKQFPDSLELYDDLAVSYSKTNDQKTAIKLMLEKEKKQPGLYETYANLGTFYLHNHQFRKGIPFISKAIKINPDAHFGREIYQQYAAEYVIGKMKKGKVIFPLDHTWLNHPERIYQSPDPDNFYGFLLRKYRAKLDSTKRARTRRLPDREVEKAIIGLLGMMKFGNYNSPILLELLGDLLMASGRREGARQLASRAYFRAAYSFKDSAIRYSYYKKISIALFHQFTKPGGKQFSIFELETLLNEEIAEGKAFYDQVRQNEISWIKTGKQPEVEFAKKYYESPKISERIQHGSGRTKSLKATRRFLQSFKKKRVVDYRPIPMERYPEADSSFIYVLDSLMGEKQDTTQVTIQAKEVGGDGNDWPSRYFWIIISGGVFLLLILFVVLRKKER